MPEKPMPEIPKLPTPVEQTSAYLLTDELLHKTVVFWYQGSGLEYRKRSGELVYFDHGKGILTIKLPHEEDGTNYKSFKISMIPHKGAISIY